MGCSFSVVEAATKARGFNDSLAQEFVQVAVSRRFHLSLGADVWRVLEIFVPL
jgi:hypothetical protein